MDAAWSTLAACRTLPSPPFASRSPLRPTLHSHQYWQFLNMTSPTAVWPWPTSLKPVVLPNRELALGFHLTQDSQRSPFCGPGTKVSKFYTSRLDLET